MGLRTISDGLLPGLHAEIERYYSTKIQTHGPTPLGVDWTCVPTQELRFVQLLKVCDFSAPFSLNDLGCGYGALLAYLTKRHRRREVDYLGIDLSPVMIERARSRWSKKPSTKFVVASRSPRAADYSIASGIFNVQMGRPDDLWRQFVEAALNNLNATSRRGFAVNFLLPPLADVTPRAGLYRVDPRVWADYCEARFGSDVQVLTGYGLREFTLLARKPGGVSENVSQNA